nr:MAG TPA: hypothetical protein [Bacteriophage sp.]
MSVNYKTAVVNGKLSAIATLSGVVTVSTSGVAVKLEPSRVVTPGEAAVTITPASGYDGFKQVTVNPIPSNYGKISFNGSVLTVE